MISLDTIHRTALTLMSKAAIEIPDDYLDGLRRAAAAEDGDLSSFVLEAMLENYDAAKEDGRAMCGDTGCPRWYVKLANEARIEGGPVGLETALRRATADATSGIPLRPNRVHPLWRTDHDNNVGINAPEIEVAFEPDGDWIDLTTVHKGGLFGTDYRMLFPSDGIEGIRRFYLDSLVAFGKRGLACQPAIMGIGLGGSKDTAWCWANGRPACAPSATATRTRRSPRWRRNSSSSATASAWAPWASSANPWWSTAISRSATAIPAACR